MLCYVMYLWNFNNIDRPEAEISALEVGTINLLAAGVVDISTTQEAQNI